MDKFAVIIISYKRPNNIYTIKALRKHGYTGEIYIVVDDSDPTIEQYKKRYGENVFVFSKTEIAKIFDEGDQGHDRRTAVYARNACWEAAKAKKLEYFLSVDDDYKDFRWKYDNEGNYCREYRPVKNLDRVFNAYLDFVKSVSNVKTICMAQTGDFIGGKYSKKNITLWRKAMNTFFLATDRRFDFVGRMNEDVNTYVVMGIRGELLFTHPMVAILQATTQQIKGGVSDIYRDVGTYVKSFFSVIYAPACVKISELGPKHTRIHHRVAWNNATPKIISEKWRKNGKKGT